MKLAIIACVGKNLELGKDNNLIWHLSKDLKYFKEVTTNHTVLMGKNTFKSLPGILKKRHNIVLSDSDNDNLPSEVEVFHSIDEFIAKYKDKDETIFIIGGASIYKQFIDLCDTLYLTEVNANAVADVYFPKFNKSDFEREIVGSESEAGIEFQFVIYRRK